MIYIVFLLVAHAHARPPCEPSKQALEMGRWQQDLIHMDSTVVEAKPVSTIEGQVYVYDNYFPDHIIKYIHVDNLSRRTCGASADLKSGGVGTDSALVVLRADAGQDVRSVIDVWGSRVQTNRPKAKKVSLNGERFKSLYLSDNFGNANRS